MPLDMDVDLSPGDFVLDGDPVSLPKKGAEPPNFRPIVAKRLDGQHRTWNDGRPQPRPLCVRWGPSPLPTKRVEPGDVAKGRTPNFWLMSIAAKRLDGSRWHLAWR